jgi:tetratricopeptide (TPR) repeat protein
LSLDNELGEAYTSLGMYYSVTGKPAEAEAAFLHSIKLNPNYSQAYHWYANSRSVTTSMENQLSLLYKAAQVDPMSMIILDNIGIRLMNLGRYDEALEQLLYVIQMDPDFDEAYNSLGKVHRANGRLADAILWFLEAWKRDPGDSTNGLDLAYLYISLSDYEAAADIRDEMSEYFGLQNIRVIELDFDISFAKSDWRAALELIESLPPEMANHQRVIRMKAYAYLLGRDFPKAYEHWLRQEPRWDDPEQWRSLLESRSPDFGCQTAGIFIAAGEKKLGEELLYYTIQYIKENFPSTAANLNRFFRLVYCHLLQESYEQALQMFETQVENGLFYDWWYDGQWFWWDAVREHPRYITTVNRIEEKLAEQRELLSQMRHPK